MLTTLQKRTAQAIVNLFETGQPLGDYGNVTLLPGDPGHLTYGRSQTTLTSGNLFLLIRAYVAERDAAFGTLMSGYLDRLAEGDLTLDHDVAFRMLLRDAGDDPVMQTVQDAFFDRVYWLPAVRAAEALGITSPLGTTTVYDSHIHGSWGRMRDRTIARHGRPAEIGEEPWIQAYIAMRRAWLAEHPISLLQRTVYRMDALKDLIGERKWNLRLPIRVRGVEITRAILESAPPVRPSASGATELLRLRQPAMRGDAVRALQQALAGAGLDIEVDGVFGPATDAAIRTFQRDRGLIADGIVGAATLAALDL